MKTKNIIKIAIYLLIVLLINFYGFSQEITIIANGILKKGIEAVVTGDYVRIRTGPSLHSKIITKVNKGTEVYVLERDNKLTKIGKYNNYWYRIRIKSSGKTGWIYGAFLKAKPPKNSTKIVIPGKSKGGKSSKVVKGSVKSPRGYVGLLKLGEIKSSLYSNLITYGDLNSDGRNEIIIAQTPNSKKGNGRYIIAGYEINGSEVKKVYSLPINYRKIKSISLINKGKFPFPMLIITDDRYSQLYTFDSKRKVLRAIYRLNTKFVAIAREDDDGFFLVSTFQNPIIDYDGTLTYYIILTHIKVKEGRFSSTGTKIKYHRPLPVKKLITYDINHDGKDEIIIEIGGQNHGGGIVILTKDGDNLKQIINTGIPTYNSMPFIKMWGTIYNHNPALAVYSTNPGNSGDINTEFGLLIFSFTSKTLVSESFFKVNKMLDEVNNYRNIVPLPPDEGNGSFLVIDYNKKSDTYIINRPLY